jgi:dihydroorotase
MHLEGRGTLSAASHADVTIFDPAKKWAYRAAESHSKSKNSPFDGWKMQGKVVATIVGGRLIWKEPTAHQRDTESRRKAKSR